ncbi:hypothetical protein [Deinococcus enclensis]|uniref:DUF669 domain-containing protein n=1 Tax=Deinococcus enclensis TaxID=1049582 RepID=A0ABT9MEE4_9DEIO|nr:hypothetical protein [Deinococcus enclensis]MDP9764901.1 hypothetical protein [Deinococcus enclensis]
MAIQMQSDRPASTDTNRFEGDPGTYKFKLAEIVIDQGSDFEDKTKTFPQARFVWEDEDGDRFSDSFVKIPLGFRLNSKAKFTNRLSALVGRPLTDEDAHLLSIDLGPDINSYDDLADAVAEVTDSGRPAFVRVVALDFDGQSLIGREAMLTLGVNAKGYNTCGASGAAPIPTGAGKKKKAPAGDSEQLLDPPPAPRKNNTTDPAFGY